MHPLIESLIDCHGFALAAEATLDARTAPVETAMLTVCGNPILVPEALDIAVVAPEIVKAMGGRLTGFLAEAEAERRFQLRFGFRAFPTLVFLRHGEYLGAISRMRDWGDYMAEIAEITARAPSAPPPFELPRGCGGRPASAAAQPH